MYLHSHTGSTRSGIAPQWMRAATAAMALAIFAGAAACAPIAAAAFETLMRACPRDARICLKYGNTLTKLGSYDEAAAAFQSCSTRWTTAPHRTDPTNAPLCSETT